jgi:mRNA-degrading endonuclease toxin of MazEF toxin-antitoxin module
MKRNDIILVDLPPPVGGRGREQTGRRPAVVAQDDTLGIPTLLILSH